MHPFWRAIGKENSLWRKIVQIQPMRLRICSLRQFENTFETHNGEKLYKCNYASVLTVNLRRHLKTQSWEKSFKCNQLDCDSHLFIQTIWENTWKLTLEKVIEMQPKRLCICFGMQFEKTFENLLWKKSLKCNQCDNAFVQTGSLPTSENSLPRKVVQLQPMQLCICFGRHFEKTFENSLWKKNRSNSTNETMNLFWQAVSEDTWKLTLEHSWEVLGRAKRALHYNYLSLFLQERVQKRVGDKAT